jgi:hypothetical protein
MDHLYYMPSYEYVMANPQATFGNDGRHVPQDVANKIMNMFAKLYAND